MDIDRGRVVTKGDNLCALQAHHAPGFWPAAIVADTHADLGVLGLPNLKAFVTHIEIFLFKMLKGRLGFVIAVTRQMDLAITTDDICLSIDQNRGIKAPPVFGELGVTQIKPDRQFARGLEQHRGLWSGHAGFKVALLGLLLGHPVTRKKRRQRQLWKHHQLCAARGGFAHHLKQTRHALRTRVLGLDRAELGHGYAIRSFTHRLPA